MAHLMTSVITALITALAVYIQTGSLALAFAGYVFAGMAVLVAVLFAASFDHEVEPELSAA